MLNASVVVMVAVAMTVVIVATVVAVVAVVVARILPRPVVGMVLLCLVHLRQLGQSWRVN